MMIKYIAIIVITSFVFNSCGTSSKATSSVRPSKAQSISYPKNIKVTRIAKNIPSGDLKFISVSDSKRAVTQSKKQTLQKVK